MQPADAASVYDRITDSEVVPMWPGERRFVAAMLDGPTEDYKILVVALAEHGCTFPKQQAALMLKNSPGAARKMIEQARRG